MRRKCSVVDTLSFQMHDFKYAFSVDGDGLVEEWNLIIYCIYYIVLWKRIYTFYREWNPPTKQWRMIGNLVFIAPLIMSTTFIKITKQ